MTSEFIEIYEDHQFMIEAIADLKDQRFPYLTQSEIRAKKRELSEEIMLNVCFNLLAKLDAFLKAWALSSAMRLKGRSGVSATHKIAELLWQFAKSRDISPRIAARDLPIEDMLVTLRDFYRAHGDDLHREVSRVKGYFKSFRNWYAHGRPIVVVNMPPNVEEIMKIVSAIHCGTN